MEENKYKECLDKIQTLYKECCEHPFLKVYSLSQRKEFAEKMSELINAVSEYGFKTEVRGDGFKDSHFPALKIFHHDLLRDINSKIEQSYRFPVVISQIRSYLDGIYNMLNNPDTPAAVMFIGTDLFNIVRTRQSSSGTWSAYNEMPLRLKEKFIDFLKLIRDKSKRSEIYDKVIKEISEGTSKDYIFV